MLHVRLGRIIEYTNSNSVWLKKAVEEFFDPNVDITQYDQGLISGLFNEWFIFDFHSSRSEAAPISQYLLKNPDRIPQPQLDELSQIIRTQQYGMYQIKRIKRGEWIDLTDIFTLKAYRVHDMQGSSNAYEMGTITARIALVNNKWVMAGSDPLYFPIAYTSNALKIFSRANDKIQLNPKVVFDLFVSRPQNQDGAFKENIPSMRILLQKQYKQLARKYKITTDFKEIADFVYKERYNSHFAQFFRDLNTKLHISEQMIFEHLDLFQSIWNYFPHKCLKNKCPAEIYS